MLNYFRTIYILLFLLLLSFTGCEYDGGDSNFHDVSPPKEDSIKVEISLGEYEIKEIIEVSEKISIPYKITISSGKIRSCVFKILNDTLPLDTINKLILIDELLSSTRVYPLSLNLRVSTQTGSIADIKDEEGVNFNDSILLYLKFINPESE